MPSKLSRKVEKPRSVINPWHLFAPNHYGKKSRDKKPLGLNLGLILRGCVSLTFKHRPVVSAEVRVLLVPVPAGQHTAITALWLSMWFSPINLREIVPLKFHYSSHHDSLAAPVVSKGLLTRQSDFKGRGCLRWDVACGSSADLSDLCGWPTLQMNPFTHLDLMI